MLGTLDVYSRVAQTPDAEHQQILSLLAHSASIAIERKAFEERLAHQSMHDPLTGLPNRLLFLDRLSLAIARCRRMHREVAVLFIDLDRFKNVNDSVGHDAGDELLVAVARRLESVLRPGDTVARFGGDEFTILCDDLTTATSRDRAIEIAQRLLESVAEPFVVGGARTFVSASVGIALATGEERPEELLRDADAAMYHAKESGRGRAEVFDETMRARAVVRHATENDLHRALERGELLLFFQPIVSLRDAAVRRGGGARAVAAPRAGLDAARRVRAARRGDRARRRARYAGCSKRPRDEAARLQDEHERAVRRLREPLGPSARAARAGRAIGGGHRAVRARAPGTCASRSPRA